MIASSTTELAFIRIRAGNPASWLRISLKIWSTSPVRTESGATSSSEYLALRDQPLRLLNRWATSSPIRSSVVISPMSSYIRAVLEL